MAETLTLTRLGIKGSLKHTLASTNPCESMIECVRRTSRNVKRWSSGERKMVSGQLRRLVRHRGPGLGEFEPRVCRSVSSPPR